MRTRCKENRGGRLGVSAGAQDELVGTTVSHYRITSRIGQGGMGVVYKAEDMKLERTVALKFIGSRAISDTDRTRFKQEARAAARIHHPNVCTIYEIDEDHGRLFFAMAFVDGRPLNTLLAAGPLPPERAIAIAIDVAEGLEAAHRHGVVHRDIKPANIVLTHEGNACILDFGLALRKDAERLTHAGTSVGTPSYMSPEQARGLEVDHRTDLWSLGVVLFQMLTGRLPFTGDRQLSVMYAIVHAEVEPAPELTAPVEELIRRALAKKPAARWRSAEEMAAELRRLGHGAPSRTQTMTSVRSAPPSGIRRSRKILLCVALAVVIAVIGLIFWPRNRLPEQKQIAVLPLQIIGNDESVRNVADGLVETITSKLSQIEDFQDKLTVIPASEIRTRGITSAEAAHRIYGANLVITGSAQKWGERIQFILTLVDAATVRQIGSRNFEFDAGKPLALRESAVNGVIRLLAVKLTPKATQAVAAGETSEQNAYSSYLRGVGYLARPDIKGNIEQAISALTQATAEDPRYAQAHAALGGAYWLKARDQQSDKALVAAALDQIRQAIALDPALPDPYVRLGEIYTATGRTKEAVTELLHAVRIAPRSAEAHLTLAQAYAASFRFPEAETSYREAVRQQPSNWSNYLWLGIFLRTQGRDAEAKTEFEKALRLTPDNEIVYRNLAVLALRAGHYQEASDLLTKVVRFDPLDRTYSTLGIAYYYQRRFPEAVIALLTAIERNGDNYVSWGNLGTVYRHMPGEDKKAQEAFEKAIALARAKLAIQPGDFSIAADLGEYYAKTGNCAKAKEQLAIIPEDARGPLSDPLTVAFAVCRDRSMAARIVRSLKPGDPALSYLKNDPDLEEFWRVPFE